MSSISTILCGIIAEQKRKEEDKDIWSGSEWKDIATLENNNVGIVGEQFVQRICNEAGIKAVIDGALTKEVGGGVGDGLINGRTVEIKCARQGTGKSASFQHELGEKPWHADFMLFVDVAPTNFYITVFPNMTEDEYKLKGFKCKFFPTRSVCWRKEKGAFKLDTTVALNITQAAVPDAHTLIWSPETSTSSIADFINRII